MATIKFRRGTSDPVTIAPAGVTAGEPLFNTALNKFFVHNGTTGIWVGGEVDNSTSLGTSQVKIPTQYAVKTYVDNNLASGAVTSVNGVTGAASLRAGTAISIAAGTDPDKGITITNIGVQSFNGSTGAVTGVSSLAGTSNQITVSGSTGAITLSLPSPMTVPGNLTVTGTLTVNGSTEIINATTIAVQDPIFTLGGTAALTTDDNKDRGIEFRWHNGSTAKTGFFGFDDSTGYMTFIPNATNTSEVFSGTPGTLNVNSIRATGDASLILVSPRVSTGQEASISIAGGNVQGLEYIDIGAKVLSITDPAGAIGQLKIFDGNNGFSNVLTTAVLPSANRTHTLQDWTGNIVSVSSNGTSGYILKSNGASTQPSWIDASAAGFTANYASTAVTSLSVRSQETTASANDVVWVAMVGATGSTASLYADTASTPFSYQISTNTLTVTKVEAIVDGGVY
jgi:hypothetical protein